MICLQFLAICDYIIYFPGGDAMAECGTHDELMKSGGAYASYVTSGSQMPTSDRRAEEILHKPISQPITNHGK